MSNATNTTIDKNVDEISPSQRNAIQDLLGNSLASDQRIFIMAYKPKMEPSEADRIEGREQALHILQQAHRNVSALNLTESQVSEALREATEAAKE